MIASGIDKDGESLRLLVAQALRAYPTQSLYPFLEDKSVVVRSAAAREVQIRGESISFEASIGLTGDKRAYVREIAVFILGQLGTPNYPFRERSIPIISDRLALDKSAAVRAAAAAALGHLNAYESLDTLAGAASDASAEVRACTAFALNNMKRRRKARELLSQLKHDENDDVRFWAND
jgi:HEAT repeat protein